jgi:hypothetical protein
VNTIYAYLWLMAFNKRGCHQAVSPISSPLPYAFVVRIHYPVVPMQILPRREILGRRLEHPRPIAPLRQHPCCSNGHIIYYVSWGKFALEMRFPDALHGEVRKIVHAFTGHEPLPLTGELSMRCGTGL